MAAQTFTIPPTQLQAGANVTPDYPLPTGTSQVGWTVDVSRFALTDTIGFQIEILVNGVWQQGMSTSWGGGTTSGTRVSGPTRSGSMSLPAGTTAARAILTPSVAGTISGTVSTQ